MSTPTLKQLIQEAEELLSTQTRQSQSYADYCAQHDALEAEAALAGPHFAAGFYQRMCKLVPPDSGPPAPLRPRYRDMTPAEVHLYVMSGHEAGIEAVVDAEIEAWRDSATLPASVGGLDALDKIIRANYRWPTP